MDFLTSIWTGLEHLASDFWARTTTAFHAALAKFEDDEMKTVHDSVDAFTTARAKGASFADALDAAWKVALSDETAALSNAGKALLSFLLTTAE